MKKVISSFLNSSMRRKLILYFFLVILVPTVTITILGNLIYKNSMSDEQQANTKQMIKQISDNIDFYIKDTENIANYLSQDPSVLAFLNSNSIDENNYKDDISSNAMKIISRFVNLHPEIAGIMIVNKNDSYVSDVMYRISRDPLTNERWYKKAMENKDNINLFSKPVGRNINNIFNYSADNVVSMSKAVYDNSDESCVGVILIDMKLDIIKQVIENVKPGRTGFVYIMDSDNEIVYSPVNKVVYRINKNIFDNNRNNFIIKRIKNKDYQMMSTSSRYTKWRTVGVFPLDETLKVINYMKYYSFFIALITLILAGILAIFFTKSIVNPITKLRMLMRRTQDGDLNVHFNSKYNDEIGELGNSFNKMIKEIKNLVELVQIEEKNKRKAEISVLQAQIKPHFLYNTLDTIQWMAKEHGADNIVKIITSLTNLLRIGLNNGNEIIKLRDEVRHVESYLSIQKVRYEDKLNYKIDIDEDILEYSVIKLILQPLVENAIYHGIKEKRGNGSIVIEGEEKDNKIHIRVIDNGVGIDEDRLREINQILKKSSLARSRIGVGIFNVNERIRLNYGDEYGLIYSSVYGEGTVVDIWHPILK
ncbi:sensor histidine kinase [Clostridium manihotivorum]|uniref:histidine kinase n=1 Tax=Clostridium manihotivorum TaxID=2320868 RepID=A0A3R5U2X2_9CLOT|nr:sensor histidine kinase [Clostridium manihotivorum]QAA30259.1 histidine kinase [Clostridium manihotivorum]